MTRIYHMEDVQDTKGTDQEQRTSTFLLITTD